MDDFYAHYAENTIGDMSSNRRILIDLPLVTYSEIRQEVYNYKLVTPLIRYVEEYGVSPDIDE